MAIGGPDADSTLIEIESSAGDPVSRWTDEPGDRLGILIKSLSLFTVEWAGDGDQSCLDNSLLPAKMVILFAVDVTKVKCI